MTEKGGRAGLGKLTRVVRRARAVLGKGVGVGRAGSRGERAAGRTLRDADLQCYPRPPTGGPLWACRSPARVRRDCA